MPIRSRSKARRAIRKLSKWVAYQYRITRRTVIDIEGILIRVGRHMSPRVERALAKGGYEAEQLRLLGQILSPEDVVLEVGAGLGLVSTFCAQRLGSEHVFAFEADPDLEPCIRETYLLNGVEPTLEMCAVGPRAERVTLERNRHVLASSVARRRVGSGPVEVSGKSLRHLVDKIHPTLVIIEATCADCHMFDGPELPGVSSVLLELHDLVLGTDGTDQVRAALNQLGFHQDQRVSSPEHLLFRH
jgi:FkbM family methyltransferase